MTTAVRSTKRTRSNGSRPLRRPPSSLHDRTPGNTDDGEALPLGPALKALVTVGPPLTIATALLFYFGWVRTAKQSEAMGLDESVFLMSTRDYVLRSLDSLYVPIMIAAVALLVWVVVHQRLVEMLRAGRHVTAVRRTARALAWTAWWAVPLAGLLIRSIAPAWGDLLFPVTVTAGLLLSEYGVRLGAAARAASGTTGPAGQRWTATLRSVLVGVLVVITLFWQVANFAEVVGRGHAAQVAATIDGYPSVVVYSARDLMLAIPGVSAQQVGAEDAAYRYRYSGLHLLQATGGRFFLVPDGWTPGSAPLIVLRDDQALRFEFQGPPR
jgi:hypothetical protein